MSLLTRVRACVRACARLRARVCLCVRVPVRAHPFGILSHPLGILRKSERERENARERESERAREREREKGGCGLVTQQPRLEPPPLES